MRVRILFLILMAAAFAACRRGGGDLEFSPDQLPEARVGENYRAKITVDNNDTPVFRMFVDQGTLPEGLQLVYEENADNAVIQGVPEGAGEFEFTIEALCYGTNKNGQAGEQSYTLQVSGK